MSQVENKIQLNDLYDYGLKIYQCNEYFKFSLDSILLAEFVKYSNKTKNILDLCTGNASVPLILSLKTGSHIDAIEIQKDIYDLAKKSVEFNNLSDNITVFNMDVLDFVNVKNIKKYDIITCNPPYFKIANEDLLNSSKVLAIARHELKITLEDIFKISSNLLDDKGELYLIHRITRLDEIINLGFKYNLSVKEVQLIATKQDGKPYLVIVRCVKNSKSGIIINEIVNVNNLKTYQNIFRRI